MRPLQVWLPFLNSTLSTAGNGRDCQRAFEEWNGEVTVWLLPDADRVVRWSEAPGRRAIAIPSERLERIDVCHVGENGYVFGRATASRFPNQRVDGLLPAWLNYAHLSDVEMYEPPETVKFEIPRISSGTVTYQEIELETRPVGMMPIAFVEESTHSVLSRWPPDSINFGTVSPTAESEEIFGPFERTEYEGVACGKSLKNGGLTLFWFAQWPEPLGALIPSADGTDILLGQAKMAAIASQSAADPTGALIRAQTSANTYLSDGHTCARWAWFWPTVFGDGEQATLFKSEDLGFAYKSMDDLTKAPAFQQKLAEPIPIRRAWGPLGLFWALLVERLEAQLCFQACAHCQRIIEGKKGKRFCGPQDNADCYRKRRAADQRRSRGRQHAD